MALISGYLAGDVDRSLRDFVGEFAGLSSTARRKQVLDQARLAGARLGDLVGNGEVDRSAVARLLTAMQAKSAPIRPDRLGVIGKEHLTAALVGMGGDPETVRYKRMVGDDEVPFVVETAFAVRPGEDEVRRLVTGVNWTPTYRDPFSTLGDDGDSLSGLLADHYCHCDEPVAVIVHLATPRPQFMDRGKTSMSLPGGAGNAVRDAVLSVVKDWERQRLREVRESRAALRRMERLARQKPRGLDLLPAMVEVMPDAYRHVAGLTGIAEARQLMYAARPQLQELTGKPLDDKYFSYQLLPRFQREYPHLTEGWNVVYDQRGFLWEPHTAAKIPLSTLGVRQYLQEMETGLPRLNASAASISTEIPTSGPVGRFQAIVFSEKEGMLPILQRAQVPERFDVALMTTKGNTVTAARELVDDLTARLAELDLHLPIFVLHDFDVMGLTILSTFRQDTERYQYRTQLRVIDAGLRLHQALAMELQDEAVVFPKRKNGQPKTPSADTLRRNSASEEEIPFLIGDGRQGRRIELNAMTSDQFVTLVEDALRGGGITEKIIPADEQLTLAYQDMVAVHHVNELIARAVADAEHGRDQVLVPEDLRLQLDQLLQTHPHWSWDRALSQVARRAVGKETDFFTSGSAAVP